MLSREPGFFRNVARLATIFKLWRRSCNLSCIATISMSHSVVAKFFACECNRSNGKLIDGYCSFPLKPVQENDVEIYENIS